MKKLFALLALVSFVFLLIGCQPGQQNITINFETNGGEVIDSIVVSATDTEINLPIPVREGYTFDGWYLDATLNNPFSIISLVTAGGELTLYAKWTPIDETPIETVYVTVTFNSDGGSVVSDQVVVANSVVSAPVDPTKEGYVFDGWYTNPEKTTPFDFTGSVSADITLYAKWNPMMLTVVFKNYDGTALKTESVVYGGSATAPSDPTRPSTDQYDFVFSGWDKAFNNVTTNLEVNATYTEQLRSYTVTFYDEDGTILKTDTVLYGSEATPPADPTKASTDEFTYTFIGWDKSYTIITGNLEVYALYEQTTRSYTVTFLDEDGTTVLKSETVNYGASATAPADPVKASTNTEAFVFDGWDKSFDQITGNLSVIAKYRTEVRTYVVTYIFVKDESTTTHVIDDLYEYQAIDLEQFTPDVIEGYLFDGWYYDDDYAIPYDKAPLEADVTLYGRYILVGTDSVSIASIHETKPVDEVKVTAVVYAIIEGPMDTFVFIQDETGYIFFIKDDHDVEIGDLITFTARYAVMPIINIAHLIDIQDIIIVVPKQSFRAPITLSLSEINDLDMYHWSSFGKDLVTSGILHVDSDGENNHYYLVDYFTDSYVLIHPNSVTDALIAAVGQRVIIGGLLLPTPEMGATYFYFTEIQQPLTIHIPTDQELLDELKALAEMYLDGLEFYSGQTVPEEMFQAPPEFGIDVTFETFGPNANLFDLNTYTFAVVETEQHIDVRVTLSLGDLEEIIEIIFILKPIEILTVAEFLAGENMVNYMVQGVVLHIATYSDEPSIIADATGFMIVMGQVDAAVGDLIVISGMRYEMDNMVFMVGTPDLTIINIIDTHQPNPLTAMPVTLADIATMDPSSFAYIEVEGAISFNPDFLEFPMIEEDPYYLMIFPLGDSYETLWSINGLHVTLRGFLFGVQDSEGVFMTFMIFINYPGDLSYPAQTDQEIADMITNYITSLNLGELRAFDYLNMPSHHPLHPEISINWTPTGNTLDYFDPSINKILSLTAETILTFDVSFNVGGVIDVILNLEYVAYPLDQIVVSYKTILQIHEEPLKDKILARGVIYYILPDEGFFMFDESAWIYVYHPWTDTLAIGDLVEFVAYVNSYGFNSVKNLSVYDDITTLNTMQDIPLPVVTSLSEIENYPYADWQYYGLYVTLTGFIVEEYGSLYLYDPFSDTMVWIYWSSYDYDDFVDLIGKHVRLNALLIGYGDYFGHILYHPYDTPVEIFNASDEDLVDMLLNMANSYLDGMVFLSGQTFDEQLLTPPEIFNATVEFETFGTNQSLLDFETMLFADVTEEKIIDVRITVTIGSITKSTEIIFVLQPIEIVDIIDVLNGTNESLYVVSGVILFMGNELYDPIIIADATGMILMMGGVDAKIGDHITIAGYRYEMDGLVLLVGMPDLYLIEVIASDMPNPLTATPMTHADIDLLDPNTIVGSPYIEISGTVTTHEFFKEGVILVNGEQSLIVFPPNGAIYDVLISAVGLNVTLKGYLFPVRGDDAPFDFYLVFINYPGDIVATTNDDASVITATTAYIEMLNQKDLYAGMYLDMPSVHPYLMIDIVWTPDTETALLIDAETGEILALTEPTMLIFTISFTVGETTTLLDIFYTAYPTGYEIPLFEPGYLGTVLTLTDPEIEGLFPGLYIYKIDHELYYEDNTRSRAELRFPMPDEYGFTHYTFETYNTITETWEPLYINDELVVATWDNYTLIFNVDTLIRLRGHAEDPVDFVSNSVLITWTAVSTSFLGWYMDESMWLTGVMLPFVGRGIEMDHPSVYDYDTFDYVTEGLGLSYQWYRINPFTFEHILIPDATDQMYETTIDDVGYKLMVRVSGDEINVGGYIQVISFSDTLIPVFGFISGLSDAGFTLNLSHFVSIEDVLEHLEIYGEMGEIEITNVQQGDNAAIYHITVDLTGQSDLWINLDALTWTLTSNDEYHMGMMQGLYIDRSTPK
jgi:uncharacterized repeat protein (TIGR02543 family)